MEIQKEMEIATFAGGCFWCTEAVFLELKGVQSVVSGYIGGETLNPTYEEICNGDTGHAEAIQITFDPKTIRFGELLEIDKETILEPNTVAKYSIITKNRKNYRKRISL
jgi:peptide-methionine (S)-S-oxide reductase